MRRFPSINIERPTLTSFKSRGLITEMIEQIPDTKPSTKRHLESIDQMLLGGK